MAAIGACADRFCSLTNLSEIRPYRIFLPSFITIRLILFELFWSQTHTQTHKHTNTQTNTHTHTHKPPDENIRVFDFSKTLISAIFKYTKLHGVQFYTHDYILL